MSDIVLITGANRGLGKQVATQMAAQGHQIVLTARDQAKGLAATKELTDLGYQAHFHQLDLQTPSTFDKVFDYLNKEFSRLDILVNNAAINYDLHNNVLDPDFEMVGDALQTNLINTWKFTCRMIPLLRKSQHARIVNVSSESGALTGMGRGAPGYSISKAGLNVLTIKLAAALQSEKILVNSVCPGWVKTDMGGPEAPRGLKEGAASIIWAATLPKSGPSGGFFRDGRPLDW